MKPTDLKRQLARASLLLLLHMHSPGAELRLAGVLGNSGESGETRVMFSGRPAPGLGPVVDAANTVWERGGATQLNRYALDGRLLATYPLPASSDRKDQMTLAGEMLLLKIRDTLYRLPVDAAAGTKPERLETKVPVMSSGAHKGRVAIRVAEELFWLDAATGTRASIAEVGEDVRFLHVDNSGTVFSFDRGHASAWENGRRLKGFPRPFKGERPQKIGTYWYTHAWHGTIFRYNSAFEPEPGVVLGGASGTFIGYLPESSDLTHGVGLAHVRDDIFAVSGLKGIVQLLQWRDEESRFRVVRRLGALRELDALALDAEGNIWTPRGSWRWSDTPDAPHTLGDVAPVHTTQPVVIGGRTLCFIKNHYNRYFQAVHGPFIDEHGWAHFAQKGLDGVKADDLGTGAAAIETAGGKPRLLVTRKDGKAMEFGLNPNGQLGAGPKGTFLPSLTDCTSLAWVDGRLLAADGGEVVVFDRGEDGTWRTANRRISGFGPTAYVHGDGKRFAVSDTSNGVVHLYESLTRRIASCDGLDEPRQLAVCGDRIAVIEAGRQRLVKLELSPTPPVRPIKPRTIGAARMPLPFDEAEYVSLGRPGGLPCALALRTNGDRLSLAVRTTTPEVTVGVAGRAKAYVSRGKAIELPPDDWSGLRLAVALRTPDQRERLRFLDGRAIHAPFSDNPATWAPFDLAGYRESVAERKQQIRIAFEQPVEGKATLAVEDEAGHRVRNLVSGRTFARGRHTVTWDGLDEVGRLIAPGAYRWRGITHPGITPRYGTCFANGGEKTTAPWGTNHGLLHHATSNSNHVFFAATVTEGGWALMALDADGSFVQGYEHQQGFGIGHNAIAVYGKFLYCAQDGFGWGGRKGIDFSRDDWTATWKLTVARYDLQTGKVVPFPGRKRAFVADTMVVGPGSNHPDLGEHNLGGMAVRDGKIYVGSRDKGTILIFHEHTGELAFSIDIDGVRHLAASDTDVFVATDTEVTRLSDRDVLFETGDLDIAGMTIAPNGDILVSDTRSHQVRRFAPNGTPRGTVGTPGGPYDGAYDPARMVNPAGLTFGPDGKLWVTERRWNPKRILAWDLEKNAVVYEKFGMPHYGGCGSGFDPANARRWIGLGCFWDIDINAGTARPTHIMGRDEAHFEHYHPMGYSFFREAGRTFITTRGKIALLSEVLDDGTVRDFAAACGTHHFAYGCGWKPPQAYIDAFYARWPEKRKEEKRGSKGQGKPWAGRVAGVLWVDRNADGKPQQAEFDFTEEGVKFADGAWGHLQRSLTFCFPAVVGEQTRVVAIEPKGFLPNGIPDYPALNEAVARGTDVDLTPGYKRNGVATARDRFGRFVFNSDPEMNAYAADGTHLWTYPNEWSNVHGSHKAPLPEAGVMQGTLGILGMAPFDDKADVFFLNGNHGRCFLLTSDGLYLDEVFTDVRVSYLKNEYRLGGEIFGGMFDRSERDGKYYAQIGHGPYRIYELSGIAEAKRLSGQVTVTREQIAAAERRGRRELAQTAATREFSIPGRLSWDRNGKFKVELSAAIEDECLHLIYKVQDPSPWINNGREWTTLFATGDTVDLQLGVDPCADPGRREPVVGDKRLSIAPYEDKSIAILYEHRKPGGGNPVEFTSPWRGEKVDDVRQLTEAQIDVKTTHNAYIVNARIPLDALGLMVADAVHRADFGVTFGDAEGTETQLRSYWANPATMLVDDIPGEIMLHPNLWGDVTFARSAASNR